MPLDVTRASKPEHFQQIADLHASGISEGFLSTLGLPFLSQLYRGIVTSRNSGVLVAHDEKEVLGFISYAHDVRSCYKDVLKRRWLQLGWTLLPNLLRSGVYRKVLETLGYPRHQKCSTGSPREQRSDSPRPELLSMAVSSKARGQGIGKLLVAALEKEFRRDGVSGYFVVTHADDPVSTGFYSSRGFRQTGSFSSHGKPMIEFFKELVL